MDSCQACSQSLSAGKTISCSGSCGLIFHHTCVGLTKHHYSAWTARIGLLWFCDSCRLSFNPATHNRESIIMKALRELLIRTDSIDTRLGNYGDNLRTINKTLYGSQQQCKQTIQLSDKSSFLQNIDQLNLDDTIGPINRSRSCDESSFFEVLDEINSSVAQQQPDRLMVGNRRVQILAKQQSRTTSNTFASTPAVPIENSDKQSVNEPSSLVHAVGNSNRPHSSISGHHTSPTNRNQSGGNVIRRSTGTLNVAKIGQATDDMAAFYVTPFTPDQREDDVKQHIHDIVNVDSSLVKVVKLVPRGKSLDDLSFVSFKVTVSKAVSNVVGDRWYWPEGVTIRAFEHNPKNDSASTRPNLS